MKRILSVLVFAFATQAKAGALIEPFLGYDMATVKYTSVVGSIDGGAKSSGFDYGARFGYKFGAQQGFWMAAEYMGGSGKNKDDADGSESYDYTRTALSAVFGYDFGRFNMWAGYGFSDAMKLKTDTGDVDVSGTNMRIGFGVDVANHVAINLDYSIPKYTKVKTSSAEVDMADVYSKYDVSDIMLSVSFPFDLSK